MSYKQRYIPKTEIGRNIQHRSLRSKFIYPIADILSEYYRVAPEGADGNYFYNIFKNARTLLNKNYKIIENHYNYFLDEFVNSNVYDEIYELNQYHKKLRKPLIISDDTQLKKFYKFFDDKTFKLNKDVYLELKTVVMKNNRISAKRLVDLIPAACPLLDWLNENYT